MNLQSQKSKISKSKGIPERTELKNNPSKIPKTGVKITELVDKDYLRRILDLTAQGIRSRILQITEDLNLPKIATENDRDIYYLLKQLLGGENQATGVTIKIRSQFAQALGVNVDKLVNAARYLYIRRNQWAHMNDMSQGGNKLITSFEFAIELFECFGASATDSLKDLLDLSNYYLEHSRLKPSPIKQSEDESLRNSTVCQCEEPPTFSTSSVIQENNLQLFIQEVNVLITEMSVDTQPVSSVRTRLAIRFVSYCTDLNKLVLLGGKLRDYDEAGRLQELKNSITQLIVVNSLDKHLDSVESLVGTRTGNIIDRLIKEEEEAIRRQEFVTPFTGAKAISILLKQVKQMRDMICADHSSFRCNSLSFISPERLDGSFLWFGYIGANSAFNLARQGDQIQILQQAHIMFYPNRLHVSPISFVAWDLRKNGYSADELKYAGYSIIELMQAGYTATEMKKAGFHLLELAKAKYKASDMKEAGFSASELKGTDCFSLVELVDARYVASQLKEAGYSVAELIRSDQDLILFKSKKLIILFMNVFDIVQ